MNLCRNFRCESYTKIEKCQYCGLGLLYPINEESARKEICFMAETFLANKTVDQANKERQEYETLKATKQRWEYLDTKYGNPL